MWPTKPHLQFKMISDEREYWLKLSYQKIKWSSQSGYVIKLHYDYGWYEKVHFEAYLYYILVNIK